MRVLLDTNILISGLWIAGSPPARLLDEWRAFRFTLVSSQAQFDELIAVFARPKIARRITPEKSAAFLADLRLEAVWATNLPDVDLSPDPADNRILATAISAEADLIVSGDRSGMLALGSVSGIPILTARQALDRI